MNYLREKYSQFLLEAEICYWLHRICFPQLGKAYNISLTDTTIEVHLNGRLRIDTALAL